MSSIKTFSLVLLVTTITLMSILEGKNSPFHFSAFGQGAEEDYKKYDIVLLSHSYVGNFFTDELIGEILNNGTATIKAVEMTAIFYDEDDETIGSADSGTSPYTINPGDTASFTIEVFDEAVKANASSYDFTAKWKDEFLSNNYFIRLAGGDISDDTSNDGDDEEEDEEES
ncbi:FxLYD domain-containing protein [Candidatus Nitrosocosmicus franklandus]|uniref:FxLYD domain-containing protein n=1 Tax=Candidatus Nitrosocosmicus franklandianus TaxID=1798806 RepID=UPI00106A1415|nr:FxLYD domain-containing protein [Candidatus Nitrosocosmicus franklandus]